MAEQLAVIKNVQFGMGDRDKVVLMFETYISEHEAAYQVIPFAKVEEIIADANVVNVGNLDGKVCWVEKGPGTILFKRMAKI